MNRGEAVDEFAACHCGAVVLSEEQAIAHAVECPMPAETDAFVECCACGYPRVDDLHGCPLFDELESVDEIIERLSVGD